MSKQRQKGTAFETLIVNYLRDSGAFPYAERRALHGTVDKGDITGTPGIVWECKNHKQIRLAEWIDETELERGNANADLGILVAKRAGRGNPADQYAVLPLAELVYLLRLAGFAAPEN